MRLGVRAHVRPQTVAPRHIDVLPDNLLEVGGYSRVREEVVGDRRRQVDEQVHIAIRQILRPHYRAEYRNVDDAARSQFDLVSAQTREDVCKKRHMQMHVVDGGLSPVRSLASCRRVARKGMAYSPNTRWTTSARSN